MGNTYLGANRYPMLALPRHAAFTGAPEDSGNVGASIPAAMDVPIPS